MDLTLNNQQQFPIGTTVKAYLASHWSPNLLPPSGAPIGASAAEAVVSAAGDIAFTGLEENTKYFAAAQVGGVWRYVSFSTAAPASEEGSGEGPRTFYETHTWTLHDEVKVPSDDTDFIAPMRLKLRGNQTCKIVAVEYRVNNGAVGTRFTFKLQSNGEDIVGFTGIQTPESPAWAETDPADQTLASNDSIAPVVTAITGTPKNGSVTIVLEHTVT